LGYEFLAKVLVVYDHKSVVTGQAALAPGILPAREDGEASSRKFIVRESCRDFTNPESFGRVKTKVFRLLPYALRKLIFHLRCIHEVQADNVFAALPTYMKAVSVIRGGRLRPPSA